MSKDINLDSHPILVEAWLDGTWMNGHHTRRHVYQTPAGDHYVIYDGDRVSVTQQPNGTWLGRIEVGDMLRNITKL